MGTLDEAPARSTLERWRNSPVADAPRENGDAIDAVAAVDAVEA